MCVFFLGKTLYVPKMHPEKPTHMDFLQIRDEEDLRSLPGGQWGIPEPAYTLGDRPRRNGKISTIGNALSPLSHSTLPHST
jgi:hypothetical protein